MSLQTEWEQYLIAESRKEHIEILAREAGRKARNECQAKYESTPAGRFLSFVGGWKANGPNETLAFQLAYINEKNRLEALDDE